MTDLINIGTTANDRTGDTLRVAFGKLNTFAAFALPQGYGASGDFDFRLSKFWNGASVLTRVTADVTPTIRTVTPGLLDERKIVLGGMHMAQALGSHASYVRNETRVPVPFLDVVPSEVWAVLYNGYIPANAGDAGAGNSATLAASLEINGVTKRFGGALHEEVLASGAYAIVGPLTPADFGLTVFPASTTAWIRSSAVVGATGQFWPAQVQHGASTGVWSITNSTPTTQIDGTGTFTNTGGTTTIAGHTPVALIGKWAGRSLPSVLVLGDSIPAGQGDTADNLVDTGGGFAVRALRACRGGASLPYAVAAKAGDRAYLSYPTATMRQLLATWATDVIDNMATNDFAAGRTSAATITAKMDMANLCYARGVKRIAWTDILPRTTSTDSWATAGNQTKGSPYQTGGAAATYMAAVPSTLGLVTGPDAFIAVQDTVKDAGDAWLWKSPSWTTDGIHPLANGHAAMAVPTATYLDTLEALHNTTTPPMTAGTYDIFVADDAGSEWRDDVVVVAPGHVVEPRSGQKWISRAVFFPAGVSAAKKTGVEGWASY